MTFIPKDKIIKEFKVIWKKHGPFLKKDLKKYMSCNEETIRYKFNGVDNLAKVCNVEFLKCDMAHTKGMTWEEIMGKEKANKLRKNRRNTTKGKTLEEIHGVKKAKELKNKIAIKQSKNLKEKSWVERYGEEKTIILKQQKSILFKGNKNARRVYRDNIIIELQTKFKLYGAFKKCEFDKFMSCCNQTARSKFGSLDDLAIEAGVEFKFVDNAIFNHGGRLGKDEKQVLDMYEKKVGLKIERQVPVRGFNGKLYFADGHIQETNQIVEYDEMETHKYKKVEDFIREKAIKDKLGCTFIRLKEEDFLGKLK